jgi:hypothetical protein
MLQLLAYMDFFRSAEETYLEQTEPFSTLKIMILKKYSLQAIVQFSNGNNILETPASNIGGIRWTSTCASSTHLNRSVWKKESQAPL